VRNWLDTPVSSGNSYLIPARLRLKLVAVSGDCTFTVAISGQETEYEVLQGKDFILTVQANSTLTVDAKGEVYVDLGFESSEWGKIIGINDPENAGYGVAPYGVAPYGV
jgi:hypothetical protein